MCNAVHPASEIASQQVLQYTPSVSVYYKYYSVLLECGRLIPNRIKRLLWAPFLFTHHQTTIYRLNNRRVDLCHCIMSLVSSSINNSAGKMILAGTCVS